MLQKAKYIFIVGIKGVAMSNLSVILTQMGHQVTGCDVKDDFITNTVLSQNKIQVHSGFDFSIVPDGVDLVVYSAAHGGDMNPLVKKAIQKHIKVIPQSKLLGEIINMFKTSIAVSGCHGKTTTSALLAYSLKRMGKKPSYLVGAPSFHEFPGGAYDGEDCFIVEADEYGINPPFDKTPKFLDLNPDNIICTNIDFDHPDVYQDIEQTKAAFLRFFNKKKLYLCIDDYNIRALINENKIEKTHFETYGFSKDADLRIEHADYNEKGSSFDLIYKNNNLGNYKIALYGEKNVLNCTGAILTLLNLGCQSGRIRDAIKDFSSVKRRFEQIYYQHDIYLFDDYAHHPVEINALLMAVQGRFKARRIVCIFQPHTYSRTASLKEEFKAVLGKFDICLLAPIFPSAREKIIMDTVTSFDLIDESVKEHVMAFHTKKELIKSLAKLIRRGDVILTVGAGDIYELKDDIIQIIQKKY
ncbi:MAG: UDP-N-acetylmuramate--L-alanine ligase [Patescibacteria group bacterium]